MQEMNPFQAIIARPLEAALIFLGVFFLLAVFLNVIDFFPEPVGSHSKVSETKTVAQAALIAAPAASQNVTPVSEPKAASLPAVRTQTLAAVGVANPTSASTSGLPTRLVISKIGIDTPIMHPTKTDIASLDAALLSGAALYPGSALPSTEGSVLIFGHQSYLPVVRNKAFKALNDVQKLVAGDTAVVFVGDTQYTYRVRTVTLTTVATGEIPLETAGHTLTLVTCNSLGSKEERYIIKADLIVTN